jgi:hypothetical protein
MTYDGSCHCGALRFRLTCEPVTDAIRCNCSICSRRGLFMSSRYFPPEAFSDFVGREGLACYRWGDRMVNFWFCPTCGVHVFHDTVEKPGHCRVNLGCLDGLDVYALPWKLIDGKSFPVNVVS